FNDSISDELRSASLDLRLVSRGNRKVMPVLRTAMERLDRQRYTHALFVARDSHRVAIGECDLYALGQIVGQRRLGSAQSAGKMAIKARQVKRAAGKLQLIEQVVDRRLMQLHASQ